MWWKLIRHNLVELSSLNMCVYFHFQIIKTLLFRASLAFLRYFLYTYRWYLQLSHNVSPDLLQPVDLKILHELCSSCHDTNRIDCGLSSWVNLVRIYRNKDLGYSREGTSKLVRRGWFADTKLKEHNKRIRCVNLALLITHNKVMEHIMGLHSNRRLIKRQSTQHYL